MLVRAHGWTHHGGGQVAVAVPVAGITGHQRSAGAGGRSDGGRARWGGVASGRRHESGRWVARPGGGTRPGDGWW
jgi:hypothetical protein